MTNVTRSQKEEEKCSKEGKRGKWRASWKRANNELY